MALYRALLHLYPADFRHTYGDEMCAIFARRRQTSRGLATPMLWLATITDVIGSALRLHLDVAWQDTRYAVRQLARTPAFTLTAIAVAALGIGATTAAFSIADHVLMRPLPFAEADRLVRLYQDQSARGYSRMELSPANYEDYRRENRSFAAITAFHSEAVNLTGSGEPQRLEGAGVTASFFQVLRAPAALGRTFVASDDGPDTPRAVILSHQLWSTTFGSDPSVVGRTITMSDTPHLVLGVMPRDFAFPARATAFWSLRRWTAEDLEDRANTFLLVVGRLRPEVSLAAARAELNGIAADLERAHPVENAQTGATVVSLRDVVTPQARLMLLALSGAALCMLLIACANLAGLLLTRATLRQQEVAVRAAMGAGRRRLIRQMLTESLLLAALGGVGGIALAMGATPFLAGLAPVTLPVPDAPLVDTRLLGLTTVVTLATGFLFGLAPALRSSQSADDTLKGGARVAGSRAGERLRSGLVVAEVAASAVLLASAGLLIAALHEVQRIDPGFRAADVLTLRTTLPLPHYEATARREALYERVLTDIRALPGVQAAGYTSFLPLRMRGGIWPAAVDGQPPDPARRRTASLRFVTPGYLSAMGIPLLRGRDVSTADRDGAPDVAVVSESFLREHLPDQDPLGRQVTIAFRTRTIVGVVGHVRVRGLERISEPQVYAPSGQVDDGGLIFYAPQDLVVRADTDAVTLVPAIRAIVRQAEPRLPISDVQPMQAVVETETASRRVQVAVVTAFASVAVLLAAIGIHGLLSFQVSAGARDIGVKLALGARPSRLLGQVVRRGVVLGAAGVLVGVPATLAAGRLMQALLAGVSPSDPAIVAVAALVCLTMTILGSVAPALRVLRIDPARAIRQE